MPEYRDIYYRVRKTASAAGDTYSVRARQADASTLDLADIGRVQRLDTRISTGRGMANRTVWFALPADVTRYDRNELRRIYGAHHARGHSTRQDAIYELWVRQRGGR